MPTTADTYNGWANRETWAASLHIDNDEGTYTMVREHLEELTEYPEEVDASTLTEFADYLEDLVTELCDPRGEYGDNDWGNLARGDIGSMWRVEWLDIAQAIASEVTLYVGTINMAGYLPESDPFYSTDPRDVTDYLADELERGSEDNDSFDADEVDDALADLRFSGRQTEGLAMVGYRSGHLVYQWGPVALTELMGVTS